VTAASSLRGSIYRANRDALPRHRQAILDEAFNIELNSFANILHPFFDGFTLSVTTRQDGTENVVSAFLLFLENHSNSARNVHLSSCYSAADRNGPIAPIGAVELSPRREPWVRRPPSPPSPLPPARERGAGGGEWVVFPRACALGYNLLPLTGLESGSPGWRTSPTNLGYDTGGRAYDRHTSSTR